MEIKQHHYELRSGNRSCLHNLMISNHKESNLMVMEHHYVKSRSFKRSYTPEEVTSRKKSSIKLTKRNSKIHKKNIEAIKKNKEKSMTGSVTNNQNTKQIFINGQSENKENISDYKIERKYKGIIPCRVLIIDCLSKVGERKDPQSKPGSVYDTCKQANESWNIYSETDHIYSQASQCPYEVVANVLTMSNVSKQFIHKGHSGNNFVSRVSYQNQVSRRTTVISKETTSQFHPDTSENISRMYALDSTGRSALNESMHRKQFIYMKSADTYNFLNLQQSIRKWLHENMWMWVLLSFLLPLFMLGFWYIMGYLLFSPVIYMSENVTDGFFAALKADHNESRIVEEKSINNSTLVSRIMMFEKEQTYLKEYLMNITHILEDYKKRQADFQKEYNDKNTEILNKLNINELNSTVNNELKMIKHKLNELRNLSVEFTFLVKNYTETQVDKILSDYLLSKISKGGLTENVLTSCNNKDQTASDNNGSNSNTYILEEHVRKIVKEILQIYDADKTGQVDYALESAGGEVISTRDTQEYNIKLRVFTVFGLPLYYQSYNNDPRTVIQKNAVQPGTCWAFQNFPGYLLIRLRSAIYVTGFTLEHVSRLIVPAGNISSAPKNFSVWGLTDENDPKPMMFGNYEFARSEDNLQYFPVQNTEIKKPYEYIELKIYSNHGQLNYTCLYKFRVHGKPT